MQTFNKEKELTHKNTILNFKKIVNMGLDFSKQDFPDLIESHRIVKLDFRIAAIVCCLLMSHISDNCHNNNDKAHNASNDLGS